MPKNSLQELDEILAKTQRLNSNFVDAATSSRYLNRGVSLLFSNTLIKKFNLRLKTLFK